MRRSAEQLAGITNAAIAVLGADPPMTLRQTFYQLVVQEVINKTEADYKMLGRLLVKAREEGSLPWDWVVDLGRRIQLPQTYDDHRDALQHTLNYYRVDRQRNQSVRIVVVIESAGLGSVLWPLTAKYGVPLVASGGYASASIKYQLAQELEADGRPVAMFYYGDYDPSGQDISRDWKDTIQRYAPELQLDFTHSALTPAQISDWRLPGRPPKQSDSRAAKFRGLAVELDALPKRQLLELVELDIVHSMDSLCWDEVLLEEEADRERLREFING